jgi:hypothetical protein
MVRPLRVRGDPLKQTMPRDPYLFTRAPGWVGDWDGTGPDARVCAGYVRKA